MTKVIGIVQNVDGVFFVKTVTGEVHQLQEGDEVNLNDLVYSNDLVSANDMIRIEFNNEQVLVLKGETYQLLDDTVYINGDDIDNSESVVDSSSIQNAILAGESLDELDDTASGNEVIQDSVNDSADYEERNDNSVDIKANTDTDTFGEVGQVTRDVRELFARIVDNVDAQVEIVTNNTPNNRPDSNNGLNDGNNKSGADNNIANIKTEITGTNQELEPAPEATTTPEPTTPQSPTTTPEATTPQTSTTTPETTTPQTSTTTPETTTPQTSATTPETTTPQTSATTPETTTPQTSTTTPEPITPQASTPAPVANDATISIIGDSNVDEGNTAEYTLVVSKTPTSDVVVTLGYEGTANGESYNGTTIVTIPAGQTSVTFNILTIDDSSLEGGESYTIAIKEVSGGGFDSLSIDESSNDISTVVVEAVNDAPEITITSTNNFTEDSGIVEGDVVSTYTTNDAEGDTVSVTLSDTINYALDGAGNVVLTQAGVDLVNSGEALPSFILTPNDGTVDGISATADPAVTAVNDGLLLDVTTVDVITEDSVTVDTVVATSVASDEDGGDIIFSITNDTAGNYVIDSTTGTVTLSANGVALVNSGADLPNFEVSASSTTGLVSTATAEVNPVDTTAVNDGLLLDVTTVDVITEDSVTVDTVVATSVASDEDGGDIIFSITNDTAGNYVIDSTTGTVTLSANGVALVNSGVDLLNSGTNIVNSAANLPSFEVSASSTTGLVSTATAEVSLVDTTVVNHIPEVEAESVSVIEDSTISGQIDATDVDGDNLTFAVRDGADVPNGLVVNSDGSYTFDAGSYDSLNSNENQVIVVPITVSDGHGGSVETTLSIDISGVNNDLTYVSENAGYSNVVGIYEVNSDGNPISGTVLIDNQNGMTGGVHLADLEPGNYEFFLIANGASAVDSNSVITFDNSGNTPVLLVNGEELSQPTYYTQPELNADGEDHFIFTSNGNGGTNISIEDLSNLGDADFADIVLSTNFEMANHITIDADVINSSDTGSSQTDDITSDNTPTITGNTESHANIEITDENGSVVGTGTADKYGDYSITTTELTDGTHTLNIKATGGMDSASTTTQTVTVDTVASDIDKLEITNIVDNEGDHSSITMYGTGAETGNTITLYDESDNAVQTAEVQTDGTWSADITNLDGTPVNDNEFFKVTETDTAGNVTGETDTTHYNHYNWSNASTDNFDDYDMAGSANDSLHIDDNDLNDYIVADGGDGTDTVTFTGNKADYTITTDNNGYTIVTESVSSDSNSDGTGDVNELRNVETINFADGTYDTATSTFTSTIVDEDDSSENNGFGNGDQGAPGDSLDHNNAENATDSDDTTTDENDSSDEDDSPDENDSSDEDDSPDEDDSSDEDDSPDENDSSNEDDSSDESTQEFETTEESGGFLSNLWNSIKSFVSGNEAVIAEETEEVKESKEDKHEPREEPRESREERHEPREEPRESREDRHELREEPRESREDKHEPREEPRESREDRHEIKAEVAAQDVLEEPVAQEDVPVQDSSVESNIVSEDTTVSEVPTTDETPVLDVVTEEAVVEDTPIVDDTPVVDTTDLAGLVTEETIEVNLDIVQEVDNEVVLDVAPVEVAPIEIVLNDVVENDAPAADVIDFSEIAAPEPAPAPAPSSDVAPAEASVVLDDTPAPEPVPEPAPAPSESVPTVVIEDISLDHP